MKYIIIGYYYVLTLEKWGLGRDLCPRPHFFNSKYIQQGHVFKAFGGIRLDLGLF